MSLVCENYGLVNGSSCACPVGFGGSTCSQPGCGGNIFQGASRPLVPLPAGSNTFANLTSAGCSCEADWTGVGCNVCQTASACQSAFGSSGAQNSSAGLTDLPTGVNTTMTCNTTPRVYASSEMSCQVLVCISLVCLFAKLPMICLSQNPTLQAIYPLSSTLNIQRTLNPSYTPLPNVTGFGTNGSMYAQLFYEGVEQFYCAADSCTQDLSSGSNTTDWNCNDLKCTCRAGTTFCGGVVISNLTGTIAMLSGAVSISCNPPSSEGTASCSFKQSVINSVFGSGGLTLNGCTFGECVRQNVIDSVSGTNSTSSSDTSSHGSSLSSGVIAGLAVVGGLIGIALLFLIYGFIVQRRARRSGPTSAGRSGGVAIAWNGVSYFVPQSHPHEPLSGRFSFFPGSKRSPKVVLDSVSGCVQPGQMMAILGPSGTLFSLLIYLTACFHVALFSRAVDCELTYFEILIGAGKTTLIEILAGKNKIGQTTGSVTFPAAPAAYPPSSSPLIGFVPQQDVLPPMLTVSEALLFAARLRLPESIPESEKLARVDDVIEKLGLGGVRDVRIGDGEKRGISGGEMRRVSIGLELVAKPDVLILDEPTSGLDSVSAAKVANVLKGLAHDKENPTAVIASIHQPRYDSFYPDLTRNMLILFRSSQLYQTFDQILLLSHGRALYCGSGGFAPSQYFSERGIHCQEGYNVADFLLEVASSPPVTLFPSTTALQSPVVLYPAIPTLPGNIQAGQSTSEELATKEQVEESPQIGQAANGDKNGTNSMNEKSAVAHVSLPVGHFLTHSLRGKKSKYAATFLTQLEVLSGREWKILKRYEYTLCDLFLFHSY